MTMSKRNHLGSPNTAVKKSKTIPSTERTHILDMNDDCLEAVFSHLDPIDLCAVAQTCRRFESVADDHFRRKYRDATFEIDSDSYLIAVFPHFYFVNENFLQLSGNSIRKLVVDGLRRTVEAHIWNDICEKCTQLKELVIKRCGLGLFPSTTLTSDHTLRELETLCFSDCIGSDEDFTRFMNYFANFNFKKFQVTGFCVGSTGEFFCRKEEEEAGIQL